MERIARFPRGGFAVGTLTAVVSAIAIFAFGAPPWILIPAMLIAGTAYAELRTWVDRRFGRH